MGPKKFEQKRNNTLKDYVTSGMTISKGWHGSKTDYVSENSNEDTSSVEDGGNGVRAQMDKQFKKLMEQLKMVRNDLGKLRPGISDRIKEVESGVEDVHKDITYLKQGGAENAQNLKMTEGKIEKQNIELTTLREKVRDKERYFRGFNVRIVGMKEVSRELFKADSKVTEPGDRFVRRSSSKTNRKRTPGGAL